VTRRNDVKNPEWMAKALRGIRKDSVTGEIEDYAERWKDDYTRLVELYGKESEQVKEYLAWRNAGKSK